MKSSSATMMAVLLVAAMVSVGLAMTNEERRAKGSPKYMTPGGMAHVVEEKIKQVVEERAFNATLAAKIAAQGDSMAQTQSEQVNFVPSERTPPNKQTELKAAVGGLVIATTRVKATPSTGPLISEPLAAREKPRAKTTSYDMSWMEEFSSKVAAVPTTRSSPVPQATSLVDGANVNKRGLMTPIEADAEKAAERLLRKTGEQLLPEQIEVLMAKKRMPTEKEAEKAADHACSDVLTILKLTFQNQKQHPEWGTFAQGYHKALEDMETTLKPKEDAPYWIWKEAMDSYLMEMMWKGAYYGMGRDEKTLEWSEKHGAYRPTYCPEEIKKTLLPKVKVAVEAEAVASQAEAKVAADAEAEATSPVDEPNVVKDGPMPGSDPSPREEKTFEASKARILEEMTKAPDLLKNAGTELLAQMEVLMTKKAGGRGWLEEEMAKNACGSMLTILKLTFQNIEQDPQWGTFAQRYHKGLEDMVTTLKPEKDAPYWMWKEAMDSYLIEMMWKGAYLDSHNQDVGDCPEEIRKTLLPNLRALARLDQILGTYVSQMNALMKAPFLIQNALATQACDSVIASIKIHSQFTNGFDKPNNAFDNAVKQIHSQNPDDDAPYSMYAEVINEYIQFWGPKAVAGLDSCPEDLVKKLTSMHQ